MKNTIETLNYSTHALEWIERQQKKIPSFLLETDIGTVFDFRFAIDTIADLLKESVKFLGPENGAYFQRVDVVSGDAEFPHLPFDSICLEYHCSNTDEAISTDELLRMTVPEAKEDQACVLAFYPEESGWVAELVSRYYGACINREYVVMPITLHRGSTICGGKILANDEWLYTPSPVLISPLKRGAQFVEVSSAQSGSRAYAYSLMPPDYAKYFAGFLERSTGQAWTEGALGKIEIQAHMPHLLTILELCNLLECTNVSMETIPAPVKLNKKRARSGKPSISEYRILTVGPMKERAFLPDHLGGSHASPRLHQRRGHIRKLPSGKKTWVRSCMVGSSARGEIVKDYKVPLVA